MYEVRINWRWKTTAVLYGGLVGQQSYQGIADPLRTTRGIILNKDQIEVPNLQLEQAQSCKLNLVGVSQDL